MSKTTASLSLAQGVAEHFIDGRSVDPKAIQQITQDWIDDHMKKRENEFTRQVECSVFVGTWNVNAKKQEGSLQEWLLPTSSRADIYAVGFQEIVDLNAMNVALNSNNTQQRAQFWNDSITDCLKTSGFNYRMVAEKYMVGLYLVIFVKDSLLSHIRDPRTSNLGVGLMGMMGNKGGVSIRFSFYDSTLCFICAHLAAHRENVAGRNSDFKNIYDRSLFVTELANSGSGFEGFGGLGGGDIGGNGNSGTGAASGGASSSNSNSSEIVMPSQGAARYFDKNVTVKEHDIVFWLGDLNYRIDDSLTTEEVFDHIARGDLETLRQKDQLNLERAKGRVFQGFQEGTLTFLPTYKYQPGTDDYEKRPEKKLRAPAWCDRVLWKITPSSSSSPKEAVTLLDYRRSGLIPSDHKPVSAGFQCAVKQVVERQEVQVFNELVATLKKFKSDTLPQVEITGLKVNFEKVLYEVSKESVIEIRNTGDSIVHWRFVPKLEEARVCKRWLSIDKLSGLLLPRESVQVKLTIKVDRKTAHALNMGKDTLQDALVLRIERSVDYFADVKGDYERSCFGMSLEELVQITDPVSQVPLPASNPDYFLTGDRPKNGNMSTGNEATKLSIPKELWRLIDALWTGNALKEKDLFNTASADPNEVATIRLALDRGTDFPINVSPQSIVEVLFTFLSALPRPLLPPDCYPTNPLDQNNVRSFCRKFLEELPPINYNVFVYILSFLREVLLEESYNRCSAGQLSAQCIQSMTSAIFMYDPEYESLSREEREKRETRQAYLQEMLIHLLTTTAL